MVSAGDVRTRDGLPAVYAKDRAAWRRWLARNGAASRGVWLVYYKRGSGKASVGYAEAVEEALCFGWIDSVVNAIDGERYMQLMTPRKPKSVWSKINKGRVERLITGGAMTAAGLAAIERAKTDGSWSSLDEVEELVVPADLARALRGNRAARRNFEAFPPGVRKQVLYRVSSAKRPETRARRIAEVVTMLAENRRPNEARPGGKAEGSS